MGVKKAKIKGLETYQTETGDFVIREFDNEKFVREKRINLINRARDLALKDLKKDSEDPEWADIFGWD